MEYSEKIERFLKKKGIKVGDKVRIFEKKGKIEGTLMPRIGTGNKNCLIIKLENGYNIGIDFENIYRMEIIEKEKKKKIEKIKIEKKDNLPKISILGCGGTIASRIEYRSGAVFPSYEPEELYLNFPQIFEIAKISSRKLFEIFSEDITVEHWKIIAKECKKEFKKGSEGIVLMHGTDTMHYTSAALSFIFRSLPIPIILVGAQRSSDRGSSDNLVNIYCSVIAAESQISEVCVCMHASISDNYCFLHQGTKVRKMHTSRRDTFKSINVKPYAKIDFKTSKIIFLREDFNKKDLKRKMKLDIKFDPKVGIIHIHPNINPKFISSLSKFYNGLVFEVTGLGHVPTNPKKDPFSKSIVKEMENLIKSNIPIVFAPQTIYGRLNLNVYEAGRILKEIGVIGHNCDWTPETAYVKLMWVLGHTKKMNKIKEMMYTNYAKEVSEKSEFYEL